MLLTNAYTKYVYESFYDNMSVLYIFFIFKKLYFFIEAK